MPRFGRDALTTFCAGLFSSAGVRPTHAQILADILVRADERGYPGHGVVRTPMYLERIQRGQVALDAEPEVIREGKTTAVVDGHAYFGQVAGVRAVELAIEKAAAHGVGVVGLVSSGHIGRLAEYVELAAARGFIGSGMVSVSGSVAAYGAREAVAGTNPIAYAIPGPDGEHILLDFAASAMSQGTLQHYVATNTPIPEGVLLDPDGNPTTDYAAYAGPPRGTLLPFGGYKGSGMLLMADIFGGILTGGGPGHDRGRRGQAGINTALFQVIDVEEFQPREEFLREVGEYATFVRSRPPAPGFATVQLPGDRARQALRESTALGVHVEDATWAELCDWGERLGVSPD